MKPTRTKEERLKEWLEKAVCEDRETGILRVHRPPRQVFDYVTRLYGKKAKKQGKKK